MGYKLGKRSLSRLEGVNENLVTVVKYAIGVTKQDFSVICGLRTIEEQKALVAKGASQTMKSKHIHGKAAEAVWVKLRWGAAWTIDDLGAYDGTAEHAMCSYIDTRRSQARRPFIDAPHFELMF